MARPRTPKAKAEATGRTKRDPARFEGRNEPEGLDDIGNPPDWMTDAEKRIWLTTADEIPWLNKSNRALLEIVSRIRARLETGEEVGIQALNLLRQCLGSMGATPADASKAGQTGNGKKDEGDPADQFFT